MTHGGDPIPHDASGDNSEADPFDKGLREMLEESQQSPDERKNKAEWQEGYRIVDEVIERYLSESNFSLTTELDGRKYNAILDETDEIKEEDPRAEEEYGEGFAKLEATNAVLQEALGQMDVREAMARQVRDAARGGTAYQPDKGMLVELAYDKVPRTEQWREIIDEVFPNHGSVKIEYSPEFQHDRLAVEAASKLPLTTGRTEAFSVIKKQLGYNDWEDRGAAVDTTFELYTAVAAFNYDSDNPNQTQTNQQHLEDLCQRLSMTDEQKQTVREKLPTIFG
jgi:hypothetical protein